jgi:hypothetical protein
LLLDWPVPVEAAELEIYVGAPPIISLDDVHERLQTGSRAGKHDIYTL